MAPYRRLGSQRNNLGCLVENPNFDKDLSPRKLVKRESTGHMKPTSKLFYNSSGL